MADEPEVVKRTAKKAAAKKAASKSRTAKKTAAKASSKKAAAAPPVKKAPVVHQKAKKRVEPTPPPVRPDIRIAGTDRVPTFAEAFELIGDGEHAVRATVGLEREFFHQNARRPSRSVFANPGQILSFAEVAGESSDLVTQMERWAASEGWAR